MDHDAMRGHWNELKPKVKAQWGKLSEAELEQIGGDRERLISKVQDKYGIPRGAAERQVDAVARGYRGGDEPA